MTLDYLFWLIPREWAALHRPICYLFKHKLHQISSGLGHAQVHCSRCRNYYVLVYSNLKLLNWDGDWMNFSRKNNWSSDSALGIKELTKRFQ